MFLEIALCILLGKAASTLRLYLTSLKVEVSALTTVTDSLRSTLPRKNILLYKEF